LAMLVSRLEGRSETLDSQIQSNTNRARKTPRCCQKRKGVNGRRVSKLGLCWRCPYRGWKVDAGGLTGESDQAAFEPRENELLYKPRKRPAVVRGEKNLTSNEGFEARLALGMLVSRPEARSQKLESQTQPDIIRASKPTSEHRALLRGWLNDKGVEG